MSKDSRETKRNTNIKDEVRENAIKCILDPIDSLEYVEPVTNSDGVTVSRRNSTKFKDPYPNNYVKSTIPAIKALLDLYDQKKAQRIQLEQQFITYKQLSILADQQLSELANPVSHSSLYPSFEDTQLIETKASDDKSAPVIAALYAKDKEIAALRVNIAANTIQHLSKSYLLRKKLKAVGNTKEGALSDNVSIPLQLLNDLQKIYILKREHLSKLANTAYDKKPIDFEAIANITKEIESYDNQIEETKNSIMKGEYKAALQIYLDLNKEANRISEIGLKASELRDLQAKALVEQQPIIEQVQEQISGFNRSEAELDLVILLGKNDVAGAVTLVISSKGKFLLERLEPKSIEQISRFLYSAVETSNFECVEFIATYFAKFIDFEFPFYFDQSDPKTTVPLLFAALNLKDKNFSEIYELLVKAAVKKHGKDYLNKTFMGETVFDWSARHLLPAASRILNQFASDQNSTTSTNQNAEIHPSETHASVKSGRRNDQEARVIQNAKECSFDCIDTEIYVDPVLNSQGTTLSRKHMSTLHGGKKPDLFTGKAFKPEFYPNKYVLNAIPAITALLDAYEREASMVDKLEMFKNILGPGIDIEKVLIPSSSSTTTSGMSSAVVTDTNIASTSAVIDKRVVSDSESKKSAASAISRVDKEEFLYIEPSFTKVEIAALHLLNKEIYSIKQQMLEAKAKYSFKKDLLTKLLKELETAIKGTLSEKMNEYRGKIAELEITIASQMDKLIQKGKAVFAKIPFDKSESEKVKAELKALEKQEAASREKIDEEYRNVISTHSVLSELREFQKQEPRELTFSSVETAKIKELEKVLMVQMNAKNEEKISKEKTVYDLADEANETLLNGRKYCDLRKRYTQLLISRQDIFEQIRHKNIVAQMEDSNRRSAWQQRIRFFEGGFETDLVNALEKNQLDEAMRLVTSKGAPLFLNEVDLKYKERINLILENAVKTRNEQCVSIICNYLPKYIDFERDNRNLLFCLVNKGRLNYHNKIFSNLVKTAAAQNGAKYLDGLRNNETLLHWAAYYAIEDAFRVLISCGADPAVKSTFITEGRNALDYIDFGAKQGSFPANEAQQIKKRFEEIIRKDAPFIAKPAEFKAVKK